MTVRKMPPFLAAFCYLSLLLMAAPSLQLRHRHLIVALHGHQLMQPVAFFAVIVVALVFLRNERLNFRNDILALRKLLRCAQLVELTLGSVVDDKIRFMRGTELLLVWSSEIPSFEVRVFTGRRAFCSKAASTAALSKLSPSFRAVMGFVRSGVR